MRKQETVIEYHPTLKRVALAMAILGGFLTPFMGSAINVALPVIGREFSMNAIGLSWVSTVYLLSTAMFLLPLGKLADIRGRKKIYSWGLVIYIFASLLCVLASQGWMLIGSRVLQGLGGAMIFSTGMAILTSVYSPKERGRVLGISVAAVYLGLSLGPVVGGLITQHWGWRFIFWFNIILGLGILGLVQWKLKGEWKEAESETFDWMGSLLYAVALVALIYGFARLPGVLGAVLVGCALVGFWVFIRVEKRKLYPVLNLELFRNNRVFTFSTLAALINYSATFALGFLLSLYLQYEKGMNPQQAGMILIAQPLVMAIFSPLAGRLADQIEPRIMASAGMALSAFGLLLFFFLQTQSGTLFILFCQVVVGLGFALFSSPNTHAVMGSVERRYFGVASAMLSTVRLTGQMFSMAITLLVIAVYFGKTPLPLVNGQRFINALHMLFLIFSVLCLAGTFASLARGNRTVGAAMSRSQG